MVYLLKTLLILPFLLISGVQASESQRTPSPEGARLYIISPANGETVNKIVTVKFGLQGMGVSPAGLDKAATGHHHLLIDGEKLPDLNKPMGNEVIHFGGGQTEKTIELSEGRHTLQLILGDHRHIPHNPPVISEKITIFVQ
ncbi:Uncharacterized DUF4399 domain-containing protein PA0315 [hydrothermal vent metagenome]|uniref:Uncharacterized DUF4399 domain-containing protein PA0315 n=1 Tax=hydrothermal vent metagenome TaxID=652676 RepID=A0A3B0ZZK9_9ZZZZ